jgi:DNA polymerase III sliding clamp (beta) subunit (PCNA family)
MEFEVSRVEFVKVLNLISNIVSDRQTIPILSNITTININLILRINRNMDRLIW